MKEKQLRKSSALLAAGAGATMCLTGGVVHAANVTGTIASTNGTTLFSQGDFLNACAGQASWHLESTFAIKFVFTSLAGWGRLNYSGTEILPHNAGVTVSSGMANGFANGKVIPNSVSGQYFAVRYGNLGGAGVRYGWLHVISTTADTIRLDSWGYEDTGGTIKTLAGSVNTQKLGLADGREQLVWTNVNEEGVARYEVQAKDAAGAWHAVSSEVPGAGMYSIAVAKGMGCRVVVEKVDGTVENIAF